MTKAAKKKAKGKKWDGYSSRSEKAAKPTEHDEIPFDKQEEPRAEQALPSALLHAAQCSFFANEAEKFWRWSKRADRNFADQVTAWTEAKLCAKLSQAHGEAARAIILVNANPAESA